MRVRFPRVVVGTVLIVALLIAGVVVILVLGMGGHLLVRGHALVELRQEVRRQQADDDEETTALRNRRMTIALGCFAGWWVVLAGTFFVGRATSGPRLGGGLAVAWIVISLAVGFTVAIWVDVKRGNL